VSSDTTNWGEWNGLALPEFSLWQGKEQPMKTGLAILALCAPMAVHAVNKCQGTDGKVVYSDLPCSMVVNGPPAAKPAVPAPAPVRAPAPAAVRVQPVVAPATAARPGAASSLPADLNRLPPTGAGLASVRVVDFGRSTDARLATVVSLLDSMALDGRNCEAALKADDRKVAPCLPFATVMQPGREWSQALAEVNMLMQEPGLFERRRSDFAKVSALIETISGQSQFMERRLGTR
jgi:hypothetical protein